MRKLLCVQANSILSSKPAEMKVDMTMGEDLVQRTGVVVYLHAALRVQLHPLVRAVNGYIMRCGTVVSLANGNHLPQFPRL